MAGSTRDSGRFVSNPPLSGSEYAAFRQVRQAFSAEYDGNLCVYNRRNSLTLPRAFWMQIQDTRFILARKRSVSRFKGITTSALGRRRRHLRENGSFFCKRISIRNKNYGRLEADHFMTSAFRLERFKCGAPSGGVCAALQFVSAELRALSAHWRISDQGSLSGHQPDVRPRADGAAVD